MQASEVVELLPPDQRTKVLSVECLTPQSFRARARSIVPAFDAETIWLVRLAVPLFRPRFVGAGVASDTQVVLFDDATGASLGRGTGF
jgi:hypothetical protein